MPTVRSLASDMSHATKRTAASRSVSRKAAFRLRRSSLAMISVAKVMRQATRSFPAPAGRLAPALDLREPRQDRAIHGWRVVVDGLALRRETQSRPALLRRRHPLMGDQFGIRGSIPDHVQTCATFFAQVCTSKRAEDVASTLRFGLYIGFGVEYRPVGGRIGIDGAEDDLGWKPCSGVGLKISSHRCRVVGGAQFCPCLRATECELACHHVRAAIPCRFLKP